MIVFCWLALAAPEPARVELAPRVIELQYHSAVLDRPLNLVVVMPEGANAPADLPVVFFLHGHGRNPRTLFEQPSTHDALLAAKVITVQPNGLQGWYLDSRPDGPAYQQALTEAIELATKEYGLTRDPRRRGIGGWSMGGFGAARYAVDHPDQFAALGTIVGLLDFPNADLPAAQNHSVPAHFGPGVGWPEITPLAGIGQLTGLKHWQATGHRAFDRTMNERWSARLDELGVEHTFEVLDGGHTYDLVARSLPGVLRFFEEALTGT